MTYRLLDITRLCMRAHHAAPTGIDRVELAYAEWLLDEPPATGGFVVTLPLGLWFEAPRPLAKKLVATVTQHWQTGWSELPMALVYGLFVLTAVAAGAMRSLGLVRRRRKPVVYINVSHHLLHSPRSLRAIQAFHRARFVALVHDLIPITHPEYVRLGHAARHRRRIETVVRFADGIITNSQSTLDELAGHQPRGLMQAISLGVRARAQSEEPAGTGDYFLCLGTIEPRKNHLLLLNVWRAMAQSREAVPKLMIVGRRGWENEMVLDMLERCEAIQPQVRELNRVSDVELTVLIRDALAVLMPSFAEGFGLPIAEALSLGTPVICSDVPAHREVGGDVPEYLDPLDGAAWRAAIEQYAQVGSARRAAQMERLLDWRPIPWSVHFAAASRFIDEAARHPT